MADFIPKSWLRTLARNLRDGGMRSALEFFNEKAIFGLIGDLSATYPVEVTEVHVLTGRDRFPMALWMIGSLIAARQSVPHFVFHDDGSLGKTEEHLAEKFLPNSRIVKSAEADNAVVAILKGFPLLVTYRKMHAFGKRLTDFLFYCRHEYLVSIDTDILFFQNPRSFFRDDGFGGKKSIFMKDVKDSSLVSAEQFEDRYGSPLASSVNAGLFSMPATILQWSEMEKIISDFHLLSIPRGEWFVEQTILAALAALHGGIALLPETYELTLGGTVTRDAVARHYVGQVRHLFYSEGVPKVRKMFSKTIPYNVCDD